MDIETINYISEEILVNIKDIHRSAEAIVEIEKGDLFFGARVDENIVGYVHARPSISHILGLYVHEKYQRNNCKIGTKLLDTCIKSLSNSGAGKIFAGVEGGNEKGLKFFTHYGFLNRGVGKTGFTKFEFNLLKNGT